MKYMHLIAYCPRNYFVSPDCLFTSSPQVTFIMSQCDTLTIIILNDKLFYIIASIKLFFRITQSARLSLRRKNDDILFKLRESKCRRRCFLPELREAAKPCNGILRRRAANDSFAGTGAAHQRIQYCGISVRVVRDLAPGDNLRRNRNQPDKAGTECFRSGHGNRRVGAGYRGGSILDRFIYLGFYCGIYTYQSTDYRREFGMIRQPNAAFTC